MISQHEEIEAKLSADNVDIKDFKNWVLNETDGALGYKFVRGPDDYYESGANVIRHRKDSERQEITTK